MKFNPNSIHDRLALEGLLQAHKPGDYLVLSDDVLVQALRGTRALRRSEWNALLESPVTLRRMRVLQSQQKISQTTSDPAPVARPFAANDAQWVSSQTLLRAADSAGRFSQVSDDGRWELHVIPSAKKVRVVLELKKGGDLDELLDSRPELAVVDGKGQPLLTGHLDEDGELEGLWPLPEPFKAYLVAQGGTWTVERV